MRAAKPMPEPQISEDELETHSQNSLLVQKQEPTLTIEPSDENIQQNAAYAEGEPEDYAVGINAKIISHYPESTFGPYFDAKVFDLHKSAKDACRL